MENDKPVVFIEDGIPMTTSFEVARIFKKKHRDVLEAIRNKNIPNDFHERNLNITDIIEENAIGGKVNKSYFKMTRDGFMIVMMGFAAVGIISGAYIAGLGADRLTTGLSRLRTHKGWSFPFRDLDWELLIGYGHNLG